MATKRCHINQSFKLQIKRFPESPTCWPNITCATKTFGWGFHFQLLLGSANKVLSRRSSSIRITCPSHRSVWMYSCLLMDMFLGPENICLTSVLLIICSHQTLPILWGQLRSNTDSIWIYSTFSEIRIMVEIILWRYPTKWYIAVSSFSSTYRTFLKVQPILKDHKSAVG